MIPSSSPKPSSSILQYRCLPKPSLGSLIFGCTKSTIDECLHHLLFGLPASHFCYVQNVEPGMPLFLFNYDTRKMHGVFEAASEGRMNINPYAWTQGGTGRTRFPAQVPVQIRELFEPLPEKIFKDVIKDNYYTPAHFSFELDHLQTNLLISLFNGKSNRIQSPLIPCRQVKPYEVLQEYEPNANGSWMKPKIDLKMTENWRGEAFTSASSSWNTVEEATQLSWSVGGKDPQNDVMEPSLRPGYTLLDRQDATAESWDNIGAEKGLLKSSSNELDPHVHSLDSSIGSTLQEPEKTNEELMVLEKLKRLKGLQNVSSCQLEEGSKTLAEKEETFQGGLEQNSQTQKGTYILELEDPAQKHSELGKSMTQTKGMSNSECEIVARERSMQEQLMLRQERETLSQSHELEDSGVLRTVVKHLELCSEALAEMRQASMDLKRMLNEACINVAQVDEIENLKMRNVALEHSQVKMSSDIARLTTQLAEISLGINNHSQATSDELSSPEICLLGGHDGESWLASAELFAPLTCHLKPLAPMSSPRSYAAASVLDGSLYVFGGGDGNSWYNTVELYDNKKKRWRHCRPMKLKRGSLAGATVGDRIFALGGGDGRVNFAEVEFYDAEVEDWLPSVNMLNKRFCVAAAELEGALYAIGGYDGRMYLRSVERFDPREGLWTMVGLMNSKRGSASTVVMNGKIYVLGGFDGSEVLNSVEVFDQRANCWLLLDERMDTKRSYGAAAVVEDAIYAIGGFNGQQYNDVVEFFKEGSGWKILESANVGKRCFLAAAVMDTLNVTNGL